MEIGIYEFCTDLHIFFRFEFPLGFAFHGDGLQSFRQRKDDVAFIRFAVFGNIQFITSGDGDEQPAERNIQNLSRLQRFVFFIIFIHNQGGQGNRPADILTPLFFDVLQNFFYTEVLVEHVVNNCRHCLALRIGDFLEGVSDLGAGAKTYGYVFAHIVPLE